MLVYYKFCLFSFCRFVFLLDDCWKVQNIAEYTLPMLLLLFLLPFPVLVNHIHRGCLGEARDGSTVWDKGQERGLVPVQMHLVDFCPVLPRVLQREEQRSQ